MPGHQAIAGTLWPPSHVVPLPHRRGPALPPRISLVSDGLGQERGGGEEGERGMEDETVRESKKGQIEEDRQETYIPVSSF